MKIAFSGKIASGKSTIASSVASMNGSRRIGFADKLRDIIRDLYGPGHEKNRALLTSVGMGLRSVDEDTWVNVVLRETAGGGSWVLDDVRFPNELRGLQRGGGVTVRLKVPADVRARRVVDRYGEDGAPAHLAYRDHESETGLDSVPDEQFDVVVVTSGNTSTVVRGDVRTTAETPEELAVVVLAAAIAVGYEKKM